MLPIHIDIGFLHIHHYEGLYFFTAIFFAFLYFIFLCREENIDMELMYEAVFICLIFALISGRIFSLFFWSTKEVIHNPLLIFQIWKGGITVTGGVLGGLIAGFIYSIIKKLSFFYYIQFFIPSIIIGHIIGRFGCFLNGDAAGSPANVPWGITFSPESINYISGLIPPNTKLHPTQLYEIFGNILLLLFIILTGNIKFIKKRRIIWYAFGYCSIRFIIEYFRNDTNRWNCAPFLTTGQIICLTGIIFGIILLIWSIFKNNIFSEIPGNEVKVKKQLIFAFLIITGGIFLELFIAIFAKILSIII